MMERGELSLDGFWIRPHSYVTYLDELFIVTKFKNNSDQLIEINTVTCSFETEESLLAHSSLVLTGFLCLGGGDCLFTLCR